eukprot:184915_1
MTSLQLYVVAVLILSHISFAVTNKQGSNYFIGLFNAFIQEFPAAYPIGYCVQNGLLLADYISFECNNDNTKITKNTYESSDDTCTGTVQKTEEYTLDSNIGQGALGDFNCAGKDNALAYATYLGGCSSDPIGIVWSATDVCFKYNNMSNISGGNLDNYNDLPRNTVYELSQNNMCKGCDLTMETYVGDKCQNPNKPLTRLMAGPECEYIDDISGFEIYAEAISCIVNGVDLLEIYTANGTCDYIIETTAEDSGDNAMEINLTMIFALVVMMQMVLWINC